MENRNVERREVVGLPTTENLPVVPTQVEETTILDQPIIETQPNISLDAILEIPQPSNIGAEKVSNVPNSVSKIDVILALMNRAERGNLDAGGTDVYHKLVNIVSESAVSEK